MADNKPEKTPSVSPVFIALAFVAVMAVAGAGYFFMNGASSGGSIEDEVASIDEDGDYPPMPESIDGASIEDLGHISNGIEPAANDEAVEPDEAEAADAEEAEEAPAAETAEKAETKTGVEAFLADRAMGDPAAPVRIDEFASLTCSHCASFHNNTLAAVKEKYIDTGKVYFVHYCTLSAGG